MPKFQRCQTEVNDMARDIMFQYDCYQPLVDARVKIDFVFAFADRDENDKIIGVALKHGGIRALGICRKLALKDRALGRADAEISLDGDWWETATEEERRALLDHELFHIDLKRDEGGGVMTDDLSRPILKMRPHDYEFGWFKAVAARHGANSAERIQAAQIMEDSGQYFWPTLAHAKAA